MRTPGSPDDAAIAAGVSQEVIYDARYRRGLYDQRSAVPVLTAEWEAFGGALARADRSGPGGEPLTILDWGYGTGRITNDVVITYPYVQYDNGLKTFDRDLLVVAFDVSSVGLHHAAAALRAHEFRGADLSGAGGVLGELTRIRHGRTVTVRFVHGGEDAAPATTERLLLSAGGPYLATVSWYSALGHIPGEQARVAALTLLGRVTDPRGELILSVSALGDLVEAPTPRSGSGTTTTCSAPSWPASWTARAWARANASGSWGSAARTRSSSRGRRSGTTTTGSARSTPSAAGRVGTRRTIGSFTRWRPCAPSPTCCPAIPTTG
jgi:hypothetical protein